MDIGLKWQPYHENVLNEWRKQASVNLWLALASRYHYDSLCNLLTYPTIIISTISSVGIFGIDSNVAKYLISTLLILSGVLTSVNKHIGAPEKSQEFLIRAKDYYSFIRDIDYILLTDPKDRDEVTATMKRLKVMLDRNLDIQVEPPLKIIKQYEAKFKDLEEDILHMQPSFEQQQSAVINRLARPIMGNKTVLPPLWPMLSSKRINLTETVRVVQDA